MKRLKITKIESKFISGHRFEFLISCDCMENSMCGFHFFVNISIARNKYEITENNTPFWSLFTHSKACYDECIHQLQFI